MINYTFYIAFGPSHPIETDSCKRCSRQCDVFRQHRGPYSVSLFKTWEAIENIRVLFIQYVFSATGCQNRSKNFYYQLRRNFEKTTRKYRCTKVSTDVFGKILKYGKILRKFLEKLGEILQKCKRKTWVTLGKKLKKYLKMLKKIGKEFRRNTRTTFLINFLCISVEILCNFRESFRKLKENFSERTM